MTSKTGRCLCGAVRYAFAGEIIWTGHCHCESCRRATSSPVTSFFAVPRDGFSFTGDEPGAYRSSPNVMRRFCRTCGSPVAYEWDGKPGEVHLYTTSLDDHSDFVAGRHDFWNERVAWLNVVDDLPKHEDE
ncbi:GFA family protein [Oceaniradius stylonematis]|uniref:GFA family protein n=1 Tax=Oceaniradius stylonematis TaxID=2184161 RepID=UPI000F415A82|nr:GFA family protein [Oceaniradius stylonematis]RNC90725.1 MAG: GFA family protein [Oricola sp.]